MRRKEFWEGLLEHAKTKTKLHAGISAREDSFIGTGSGISGLVYNYVITKFGSAVELYIDRGKDAGQENKDFFDRLYREKEAVEKIFGGALDWQRLDNRRACRIIHRITLGGWQSDAQDWPKIHDAMVDAMIRFEHAISPQIDKLRNQQ